MEIRNCYVILSPGLVIGIHDSKLKFYRNLGNLSINQINKLEKYTLILYQLENQTVYQFSTMISGNHYGFTFSSQSRKERKFLPSANYRILLIPSIDTPHLRYLIDISSKCRKPLPISLFYRYFYVKPLVDIRFSVRKFSSTLFLVPRLPADVVAKIVSYLPYTQAMDLARSDSRLFQYIYLNPSYYQLFLQNHGFSQAKDSKALASLYHFYWERYDQPKHYPGVRIKCIKRFINYPNVLQQVLKYDYNGMVYGMERFISSLLYAKKVKVIEKLVASGLKIVGRYHKIKEEFYSHTGYR